MDFLTWLIIIVVAIIFFGICCCCKIGEDPCWCVWLCLCGVGLKRGCCWLVDYCSKSWESYRRSRSNNRDRPQTIYSPSSYRSPTSDYNWNQRGSTRLPNTNTRNGNLGANANGWSTPSYYPQYMSPTKSTYRVETEQRNPQTQWVTKNGRLVDLPKVPLPRTHYHLDAEQWPRPQPAQARVQQPPRPGARNAHREGNGNKRKRNKSAPAAKAVKRSTDALNDTIQSMQSNLSKDNTPEENNVIISRVQELLLLASEKNQILDNCPLIIGVDATPAAQAGYLVNLKEKRLSYYVIRRNDLPWTLHDAKDPSEFEMKNFMFALTVWQDEILKWKRMRIYTDNFAITKEKHFDDKKYGERAANVLEHFQVCKRVEVLNEGSIAVNRFKNLKNFVKYIQPADDLSRWQIGEAIKFLTTIYGIDQENVEGTHNHNFRSKGGEKVKFYKSNARYQMLLSQAKVNISCYECPNRMCSGGDMLQASLRLSK